MALTHFKIHQMDPYGRCIQFAGNETPAGIRWSAHLMLTRHFLPGGCKGGTLVQEWTFSKNPNWERQQETLGYRDVTCKVYTGAHAVSEEETGEMFMNEFFTQEQAPT